MLLLQHQKIVNSARHSKRWHLHWLICQGLDLKTLVQRLRTSTSTGLQIPGGRLRGCVSESCLRNKKSPSENEETEFLKKFSKTLLEVKEDVQPTIVKGDKSKSVLFDACRLAKQLQLFGEKQWKTTSEVWVELLCYAAAVCCLPRSQIAQLGKGGELITFVWLLMAHYNLRFLQNQGFGWTKLIIHK